MSSLLYGLGRAAARGRGTVVGLWLLVAIVVGASAALLDTRTADNFVIPGSESQAALDYLSRVFPKASGASAQMVLVMPPGQRVDTTTVRTAMAEAVQRIRKVDQVATAVDPFGDGASGLVSRDGRAVLVSVSLTVSRANVRPATRTRLSRIAADLVRGLGNGARVYTGGGAFSNRAPNLNSTDVLGLVIALVVLLVVFRSLIAASMPLLTAMLGVVVSVGLIFLATLATPISSTAPVLAVMIGSAVGIDYALFLLSRHRDQLADGLAVGESVARATATAGSAVIFAGLTVIIAVLSLAVTGIPFLTKIGICAATSVAVAVAMTVTLIPALLSFAGDRLRPRSWHRRRTPPLRLVLPSWPAVARSWVRAVTRFPLLTVVVVVAGLAVCAIPVATLRLALPDNGAEKAGSPARETYRALTEHFGPGYNGPLVVTVDVITSTDPVALIGKLAKEIRALPGVAAVPLVTLDPQAETGIIQVVPTTAPDSPQTEKLVDALRQKQAHFLDAYDTKTAVTGRTAVGIDVSAKLESALLLFGLLVVGLSLALLAMVFRSVWVPVTATAGYLLSVGAAFGATSAVFVQGHFAGLFGVTHTGSVISFLPIVLMGVLFGLAMDYEVFLVSRIREDYVHGGDDQHAIESGFVAASRVVTAAALIMFSVFAAFVPRGSATIKPIAFSLAVGVLVDAFLVRMTLMPAVLALLGTRAWSLPSKLNRRLPILDVEGDALVQELRLADWPMPGNQEAISARALCLEDDRGSPVYAGIDLHVPYGSVLVVHGTGSTGKTALLFTLAGRVTRLTGDLKVLGHVLPQRTRTLRRSVALFSGRQTRDPAGAVSRALRDNVRLILIDNVDLVLRADTRNALRAVLARGCTSDGQPATTVVSCQDPAHIRDLVPDTALFCSLDPVPAEAR